MTSLDRKDSKRSISDELNTEELREKSNAGSSKNLELLTIEKKASASSNAISTVNIIDWKELTNESISVASEDAMNKLFATQELLLQEQHTKVTSKIYSYIGILPESEGYLRSAYGFINSELVTNMVGCVVQVSVEELKLMAVKYKLRTGPVGCSTPMYTLEEKCTKPLLEMRDYPTYLLGKDEMAYSFYKFEKDTCFIEKLLTSMAKEILRTKSFWGFAQILKQLTDATAEEKAFLEESYGFREEVNNIRTTGCEEKLKTSHEITTLNEHLALCKNTLQDMKKENYIKEQYIDKWEKSRVRQNHIKHKQSIESIERDIKEYRSKIQREQRVNMEVERFTHMVLVDCQSDLNMWSERYETELEEKQTKIQSLKQMAINVSDKLAILKPQYEKQSKVIIEGRIRRDELIQHKQLLERQEIAAVKIQAWWRRIRKRKLLMKKKKKRGMKKWEAKKNMGKK